MATTRELFETNTSGVMAMTQAVPPRFRARRAGVVVNATSSPALARMPLMAVYTASKTAIEGFTASLALELQDFNARAKRVGTRWRSLSGDNRMTADHHLPDGSFRNPWPHSGVPGWREVARMVTEHFAATRRDGGRRAVMESSAPHIAYPRAEPGDFFATWIGHSTVLLQVGGLNVLTDPVFRQRASPVQWFGPRRVVDPALEIAALPPLDLVLISHDHYDHLDSAAVRYAAAVNPDTTWVVPLGLGARLRRWGARDVVELDWWRSAEVRGVVITATPARHFSGRGLRDRNRTLWCGFALSIGGWRGFFAGDTAYHDQFPEVGARGGPFDFVMMPIGAYEPRWFMRAVHVDPEEAVRIYQDLVSVHAEAPPPLMLAIHWGTFRLTHEPMDEPPRRAVERWRTIGLDPERLWIARRGETRTVT